MFTSLATCKVLKCAQAFVALYFKLNIKELGILDDTMIMQVEVRLPSLLIEMCLKAITEISLFKHFQKSSSGNNSLKKININGKFCILCYL